MMGLCISNANRVIFGTNGGWVPEVGLSSMDLVARVQSPDAVTHAIVISVNERNI